MTIKPINIIGGGLSGSEAALTLAERGYSVNLYECRPQFMPEVFKTGFLAELVCSNSLGSLNPDSAPGILKSELTALGSHLLSSALECSVPGGQALTVERERFCNSIEKKAAQYQNLKLIRREIQSIDEFEKDSITLLASGPLTTPGLFSSLAAKFDSKLYFYDAVSPIIDASSVDMSRAFWKNRYGRGTDDYLNIAMNKEEYDKFYSALVSAEVVEARDNEKEIFFESCMPIEEIARRGFHTLRFGPMKPKGFEDPRTGRMPYALLQLRTENHLNSAFNIVGFQTKMKFSEQKRVFSIIPGLENIKILRYGVIHKNYYIYSPGLLNFNLSLKSSPNIFAAGQLLGSEGYAEAIATGKIAALNIIEKISKNNENSVLEYIDYEQTMIGSLMKYLIKSDLPMKKFVPMNSNFGLINRTRSSKEGFAALSAEQLKKLSCLIANF